jgi:hypothetical protein
MKNTISLQDCIQLLAFQYKKASTPLRLMIARGLLAQNTPP